MFIDFTKAVRETLLEQYPYLAQVPFDAPAGVDTLLPPPPSISWNGLGELIPFDPPTSSESSDVNEGEITSHQQVGEGEMSENSEAPNTEDIGSRSMAERPAPTWHDVGLSIAAEMMQRARDEVRIKLGYSTSAVSVSPCVTSDSLVVILGYFKE